MAKRKDTKVWKSVRLGSDIVTLIEKQAKQSGVALSEIIRRAVTKGLKRSEKDKDK